MFGNTIYIQVPRLKNPIPIVILFRTLGIISDKEICKYILLDTTNEDYKNILISLKASIVEANEYITQESAFNYVVSQAMFTPINMTKEKGQEKKETLPVMF